jgi:nucleotide-binding universal stress UspA family protein
MKPIQRILAATDFSPLGNAAVERAVMLAARKKAELQVVHAIPKLSTLTAILGTGDSLQEPLRAAAQEHLEDLMRQAGAGAATVHAVVLEGSATAVISKAEYEFRPDLIVIGAHAKGAVRQFFLGGTASRILAYASCPVLVVRQPTQPDYSRVLAAVDLEPDSTRVVENALAMSHHNRITVAHAFQSPFDSRLPYRAISEEQLERLGDNEATKATSRMAELIATHELAGATLQTRVVRGHPNPVLFDLAAEMNADLIVALRHKGSRIDEAIMGSIARLLAYHAPCDVLLA